MMCQSSNPSQCERCSRAPFFFTSVRSWFNGKGLCVVHSKKYGLIGVGGTDLSILDPYLPPKYEIRAQCYVVVNQSVFKPTGELGTAAWICKGINDGVGLNLQFVYIRFVGASISHVNGASLSAAACCGCHWQGPWCLRSGCCYRWTEWGVITVCASGFLPIVHILTDSSRHTRAECTLSVRRRGITSPKGMEASWA